MLSVIIPVLDEAESLPQLCASWIGCRERTATSCRSIIVDDGSTDGTWRRISNLAADDPRILGIRFRRNFGKAAA